jgi:hypothetical protein
VSLQVRRLNLNSGVTETRKRNGVERGVEVENGATRTDEKLSAHFQTSGC